jgi:hypothetical protein
VEVPIDTDCWQRDGGFSVTQLFAVFSDKEVLRIASSLAGA